MLYINLYSPTSGSKEKKTYIHINTVKKQQKKQKTASKFTCHYVVTCDNTIFAHHYCANTNLKGIRCNFTENILGTGDLNIE